MQTKPQYLLVLLSIFSYSIFGQNIFESDHSQKTLQLPISHQQPPATGNGSDGTITFERTDNGIKILPTLYGNNASSWMGKKVLTDDVRKGHLKNVGISYMRFPGGNSSNNYFWDGNIPVGTKADNNYNPISGTDNVWRLGLNDFLNLCDTLGNKPVMCVNASYARYGNSSNPITTAAHYAAEFVRYINITKGKNVQYWEIGNENYGPWQAGYIVESDTIDGAKYAEIVNVFTDSMKAADPTIKVGAVAVEVDGEKNGGFNWWNKKMMPICIDQVDFWIAHQYFVYDNSDWNNITVDEILGSTHLIKESIDNIEASVAKYTSHSANYLPTAMTEYNLRGGTKEVAQVSALFIAECLGEFIKNEYGMVMLWDIQNGTKKATSDGPGGDHGFYSWNDPVLPNGTPRPSFFVYYYAQKYLGHLSANLSITGDSIKGYSSIDATGNIGMVIINQKNASQSIEVKSTDNKIGDFYWHSLHANSKADKKFNINGVTNNAYSEGGPEAYQDINPFKIATATAGIIDLPANSVNFVLFNPQTATQLAQSDIASIIVKTIDKNIFAIAGIPLNSTLSVYDTNSQLLMHTESQNEYTTINMTNYSKGTYYINIQNTALNINFSKRVIVW
jgi:hypothetical protein